jgi:hypothetical protein
LRWPQAVYSLSHVALPFPPDDPIYGQARTGDGGRIFLGDVALRGEHGVLTVPPAAQPRLRWNLFHPYLMERNIAFTGAAAGTGNACPEA